MLKKTLPRKCNRFENELNVFHELNVHKIKDYNDFTLSTILTDPRPAHYFYFQFPRIPLQSTIYKTNYGVRWKDQQSGYIYDWQCSLKELLNEYKSGKLYIKGIK